MKVIYLRQVAKENISFVVQSQRDEVAKLRLVQLRKVTLPEISDTGLETIKRHTLVHWVHFQFTRHYKYVTNNKYVYGWLSFAS